MVYQVSLDEIQVCPNGALDAGIHAAVAHEDPAFVLYECHVHHI